MRAVFSSCAPQGKSDINASLAGPFLSPSPLLHSIPSHSSFEHPNRSFTICLHDDEPKTQTGGLKAQSALNPGQRPGLQDFDNYSLYRSKRDTYYVFLLPLQGANQ